MASVSMKNEAFCNPFGSTPTLSGGKSAPNEEKGFCGHDLLLFKRCYCWLDAVCFISLLNELLNRYSTMDRIM